MKLTENQLKKYIKKSVRETINEMRNLSRYFDLDSFSKKEIQEHFFSSLIKVVPVGFGNPLMRGDNDNYLLENGSRVYPAKQVKKLISNKYQLKDWQVKIVDCSDDIQITICIPIYLADDKELVEDFERLGYAKIFVSDIKFCFGYGFVFLQFESESQPQETDDEFNIDYNLVKKLVEN